jgi:hypothetical protein
VGAVGFSVTDGFSVAAASTPERFEPEFTPASFELDFTPATFALVGAPGSFALGLGAPSFELGLSSDVVAPALAPAAGLRDDARG